MGYVIRNIPHACTSLISFRSSSGVREMSLQIHQVMAERIGQLSWMSPKTQEQARLKLSKMRDKIGYPDQWRDYFSIMIDRNDFFG